MGAIALDFAALTGARTITLPPKQLQGMAGFAKRAWLLMYREGGRWSAAELRRELKIEKRLQLVQAALGEMARSGFIERFRSVSLDGEASVQYGVMRDCKVPRGVTVEELQELA